MNRPNFKYIITCNDKTITARPLFADDIEKAFSFARSKMVRADNYKQVFGIGCEPEFAKKGALLETSKEELVEVVNNPLKYFSVGLWMENSEPVAFLIDQLDDVDNFIVHKENFKFENGLDVRWESWQEKKKKNQMTYKGDLVTDSTSNFPKLLHTLFYIALKEMLKMGKTACVTEVFHILSCCDNNGCHQVDIYNKRSFNAQVYGVGALYTGEGKIVKKNICEGVSIEYYAKILEYDFEKSYMICEKEINDAGVKIALIE